MSALARSPARRRWRHVGIVAFLAALSLGGVLAVVHSPNLLLQGTSAAFAAIEGELPGDVERGAALFAFGDFGALSSDTLQTSASPWKLLVAALALQEVGGDASRLDEFDAARTFRRWGFHSPERIENWPDGLPVPPLLTPLGQNVGLASHPVLPGGVTVGNIGCAACHSGVVYDAGGHPDPSRVWIGGANTSINLQAFADATFAALRNRTGDADAVMAAVEVLFPETGRAEALLLRLAILPAVRAQVAERDALWGALLPYPAGVPGATNGLDSLQSRLGLLPEGGLVPQSAFNSVPDLGDRLFRTSFLNTGSYGLPGVDAGSSVRRDEIDGARRRALAGIIAYFTVPSMGLAPDVAEAGIADVEAITAWLAEYEPQPFPRPVDTSRLEAGHGTYVARCASCHGDYGLDPERPRMASFPNWEGDVGTDALRRQLVTPEVVDAVNGSFGAHIAARTVETYAAPPLTGLWSSGPYLHNGAVPTLWHLMHPEERPARFDVGGHSVDLDRVGVLIGPGGREPWAESVTIDTSEPGFSAVGHEAPFETMSEAEKAALLEYLKLL